MLSDFLAFLDSFTKCALIFLVVLWSNLLICQPGPAKLPAWPLALQSCCSWLQPAPGKAGTFPQHPGADPLTQGWSYASSLSENFFGKGFLAVLFKIEYICYSCTIVLDGVSSLVYGPGQPQGLPVVCLVSWGKAPSFWRRMETGKAVPLQAMAVWSLVRDRANGRERWWAFGGELLWKS